MGKLVDDLNKNNANTKARFHMPGHSGITLSDVYSSAPYDVTELGFNDNLNCPNGTLKELEENISKVSKTYASLLFTSGTTTSIFVGLGALRKYSKKIAIDQFSHKSVFEGARLWDYDVTIIPREYDKEGIAKPLTSLDNFIANNPDIKIISLTSPDYLGICINPKEIKKIRDKGILVFVDSAHGAHFKFSEALLQALTEVADIVCESWHKTLPVYTGGSVLQICNDKLENIVNVCTMLRAKLHTTSPSYVTLSSFDESLSLMKDVDYDAIVKKIVELKQNNPKFTYLESDDPTKLTINVCEDLFVANGIIPETSFGRWTNFIITPFNIDKLPLLEQVLKKAKPIKKVQSVSIPKAPRKLPKKLKPETEIVFINIEDSLGYISATDVGAYPPGVPVLFEGQKITKSHIKYLLKTKDHSFNLINGQIAVVRK
ncbi:MAG: aminotransferase class I/II-fold pyridoxal phosphate-dependent enzyme [Clostridia bacterium]|nr:aminotransferase class I/II-fold pyridoxal phosphate-dependent enzyme [Clostridia bacterium]